MKKIITDFVLFQSVSVRTFWVNPVEQTDLGLELMLTVHIIIIYYFSRPYFTRT